MVQRQFDRLVFAKAVRLSHGQFRFVVKTLDDAAGNRAFGPEPVEQEFPVRTQAAGDLLQRLQPGTHDPRAPLVEEAAGPSGRLVFPEALKVFAMQVCPHALQIVLEQFVELDGLPVGEVLGPFEQAPAGMRRAAVRSRRCAGVWPRPPECRRWPCPVAS